VVTAANHTYVVVVVVLVVVVDLDHRFVVRDHLPVYLEGKVLGLQDYKVQEVDWKDLSEGVC